MSAIDYIVIAAVAISVVIAVIYLIKNRKSGQECSGDCANCKRNCGK